ncbi:MAG: hypothetical protein HY688_01195 [Chloroflexi bacterium]|nr:hypothetical protein [Chloroflexota bacterium]
MPSRIFLVNVGANASHGGVRSPLFEDGTFELLPIPEERDLWAPTLPAYAKLVCFNDPGETLAKYVPARYWNVRVHDDPEFRTLTYGDNPSRSPRAAGLRACGPGDSLFFLARLVPYAGGRFRGPPGFYLVGFLLVEDVLRGVTRFPHGRDFTVFGANAHVRRAAYHRAALDGFWVWKGSAEGSWRLRHAVPLGRALCAAAMRDARGDLWRWDEGRSDLQTIGSYTRSARLIIDGATEEGAARAEAWWKAVAAPNPDAPVPFPRQSSLRILEA